MKPCDTDKFHVVCSEGDDSSTCVVYLMTEDQFIKFVQSGIANDYFLKKYITSTPGKFDYIFAARNDSYGPYFFVVMDTEPSKIKLQAEYTCLNNSNMEITYYNGIECGKEIGKTTFKEGCQPKLCW